MSEEKRKVRRILLHYPDDTPAGYVEFDGKFSRVYDENGNLLFEVEGIFPPVKKKVKYEWIDKILEKGLPDARKRFILYVASRYLVNVKGLNDDEALKKLEDFYYKSGGGKVYESWIRSVLRGVKAKKLLPWSLKKIQEKDKEMYELITKVLNE
ncbi:DNA primase noncatalytic subunit PriX [Sulfolobaceae archaeon RB850M]